MEGADVGMYVNLAVKVSSGFSAQKSYHRSGECKLTCAGASPSADVFALGTLLTWVFLQMASLALFSFLFCTLCLEE